MLRPYKTFISNLSTSSELNRSAGEVFLGKEHIILMAEYFPLRAAAWSRPSYDPPQSWQLCRNTSVLPIFAKNQYWRHESKHPLPLQSALPQSAVFAISVSCLCSNSIIYPEKHLRCLSGQSCAHIAGHCFQSWVKLCAAEVTAFSGHEFFTLAPPGFPHSYITWEQQKRFIAQIKFSHGSLAD